MQRKKTFYVPVVQNGNVYSEQEIPREVGTVVGIAVSGSREDLIYLRGSIEVSLSGTDVIKSGERTTQYMFGIDNPARMWPFGELPLKNEDRRIRIRYQDQDNPQGSFSAHTLEVIITYIVNQ